MKIIKLRSGFGLIADKLIPGFSLNPRIVEYDDKLILFAYYDPELYYGLSHNIFLSNHRIMGEHVSGISPYDIQVKFNRISSSVNDLFEIYIANLKTIPISFFKTIKKDK